MEFFVQVVLNGIVIGALYGLIALSFNLVYSVTKFFNFAHGILAAVGGYGVYFFFKILDWNIWLSIVLGVVVAALVGWLSEKLLYLRLRRRKASNLVLLVASLGVFTVFQALIAMLFDNQFRTLATSAGGQGSI